MAAVPVLQTTRSAPTFLLLTFSRHAIRFALQRLPFFVTFFMRVDTAVLVLRIIVLLSSVLAPCLPSKTNDYYCCKQYEYASWWRHSTFRACYLLHTHQLHTAAKDTTAVLLTGFTSTAGAVLYRIIRVLYRTWLHQVLEVVSVNAVQVNTTEY